MIPLKTIEDLISKHSELERDLSSGKIDKKLFAEKSKEYSDLNEIINDAKNYLSFEKDKTELEKIEDIEILRFLELGYKIKMVNVSENSIAVDTPTDLKKVVRYLNKNNEKRL